MTRIGTSELDVFPLSLGGNVFGWTADRDTSFGILDAYAAAGGDFIDTADGYSAWVPGNSGGESETIVGAWLAARGNRDSIVVATKVSTHPEFRGLSAANVAAAADASLRRLGTDRIDLYYAHFDDPGTPIEETVDAFETLVQQGKVRYVAVSNYSAERIEAWLTAADAQGASRPVAIQPHYNLVHRNDVEEGGIASLAEREGLSLVPYYALASGFLTGKYREQLESGDSPRAGGASKYATAQGLAIIDALEEIGRAHGVGIATTALAWLLAKPSVAAPIASASKVEQLAELVAVANVKLGADELAHLDDVSEWTAPVTAG